MDKRHEGAYLFDGLIENESDLQPNRIHGDTGAQNEVIIGLGSLLEIQIMAQIRNFKHLCYYKVAKNVVYKNIGAIFTEQAIDWDLIQTHYHDMLRVVISIRTGTVKASTVLRKLNYINDMDWRHMIHAATCKSEEFNQFIDWIAFGGDGISGENMRYNQRKIIKFGHLVANMVSLHNVVNMTRAINELLDRGMAIEDKILARFAPYWTDHINRFGIFPLNMQKSITKLDYKLNTKKI